MSAIKRNRPYQLGVIGLGARAETFTRQLSRGKVPGAELFGVCDIDEDRMRKYCEYCGHPDVRQFTAPDEFFRQAGMDAVIITTPEFAHKSSALAAMAAGKHIYLEKAMAPTSEDCREIIRAHRRSKVIAYLGFNMRASRFYAKIKEIVDTGTLGQIVHLAALEQLSVAHSASFMRRFHRHSRNSGGFLNTKCSHDLDMLQWLVGHEHRVTRVASFGGTNIFLPTRAPKGHGRVCSECPPAIWSSCGYRDQAGFVFPVGGDKPIHKTRQTNLYGGDLCVYNDDKDIVDNQTVIFEWDHGVRGNFNLQLFQHAGRRTISIWGERGLLEANTLDTVITVRLSRGETLRHEIVLAEGGHGGTDQLMLGRFLAAIESGRNPESGLAQGLAATLLAEKADQSRKTGKIVSISPDEYE